MEDKKLELTSLQASNNEVVNFVNAKYGLKITNLKDLQELETFIKYIKESLEREFLENYNGENYEDENMTIKYKEGYETTRVDSKGLKEEMPDVYELYKKVTKVKPSAKVEFK